MYMAPVDKFISKSADIFKDHIDEAGKVRPSAFKAAADYYGMSEETYRHTLNVAHEAYRANLKFQIFYYTATHPEATVADTAKVLDLNEAMVRSLQEELA